MVLWFYLYIIFLICFFIGCNFLFNFCLFKGGKDIKEGETGEGGREGGKEGRGRREEIYLLK